MNYDGGRLEGRETLALEGPDTGARGRRRWVVGAIVLLLALAGAWWAFSGRGSGEAVAKGGGGGRNQVPNVTVVAPGRQAVDRVISATGQLAAKREMPVGVAGEGGMITRVLVEPGQWVGAGQVLATVDRSVQQQSAQSLAAQVSVARADADLAQAELERAQALVDRGFISKADLQRRTATRDAALSRVKVAQAALAEQRARNGRLDIRAPAAGLVLTRQAEPGQIVSSASGVLFRMAQGGMMEMQARLAESDLVSLRPGARATVTPVGSDRRFAGQVWQVSPVIDQQTRQGVARIQLRHDPALRPGGFAAASIVGGTAFQPLLPDSAVQSDGKGSFVYIIDGVGKVRRRDVQLGQVSDTGVAIAGGLDGTERVVLSAGGFLTEGQLVKPILQKKAG
jgi:RND family efflux transporter MFP subunit